MHRAKSLNIMKHLFFIIILFYFINSNVNAKEIVLELKKKSEEKMLVHYKFSSLVNSGVFYAQDATTLHDNDSTEYIYVNNIPIKDRVLVKIDKMSVKNRTVFNDPCEIILDKNDLGATITVGFDGDVKSHGSFTCVVSKK